MPDIVCRGLRVGKSLTFDARSIALHKGISADFLPFVFDRCRQARVAGEGRVGLAIARRIVDLHGGSIAAESEGEGRGVAFLIVLPLMEEGAASA